MIDSLARSGTTLLASILNSHNAIGCIRGGFHEPLAMLDAKHTWASSLVKSSLLEGKIEHKSLYSSTLLRITQLPVFSHFYKRHWRPNGMETTLSAASGIDLSSLRRNALRVLKTRNQYGLADLNKWKYLTRNLKRTQRDPIQVIDEFLENAREEFQLDIFCQRWNNGVCYFNKWVQRPRHKWLMITRDPVHSAISRKKAFNRSYEDSLIFAQAYAEKFNQIKNDENFFHIYFEDLLENSEQVLGSLQKFLGLNENLNANNLMGTDGKTYRHESTRLGQERLQGEESGAIDKRFLAFSESSSLESELRKLYAPLGKTSLFARYF